MIDLLIAFRNLHEFLDVLSRVLPVLFLFFAWQVAWQLKIDRDYWRVVARNEARFAFWTKSALDAWYFQKPKPATLDSPRHLSPEEAQKIVDEIYARQQHPKWSKPSSAQWN